MSGTQIIECPHCRARYTCARSPSVHDHGGEFNCQTCGHVAISWTGADGYDAFKLIEDLLPSAAKPSPIAS